MWQQVGFLADVFLIFQKFGFSIDLIATSQSNVTVSLDIDKASYCKKNLQKLMISLESVCKPKLLGPCAVITLVGKGIRALLPEIPHMFEAFKDCSTYLLTQSASDLSLAFTVPEADVDRLVRKLHSICFDQYDDDNLGSSWLQFNNETPVNYIKNHEPWWLQDKNKYLN